MPKKREEIAKVPALPQKYTFGRPSTYKKEYCRKLVDHMSQGLSFESFAGVVHTTKQTLYEWVKKHPDFLDAKHVGQAKSQIFWETIGIKGSCGHLEKFNGRSWQANMRNRFDWGGSEMDKFFRMIMEKME